MKIVYLALAALLATGTAYAGTASEDLADVYQNTEAFDGGPGSTINTSPAEADAQSS